MTKTTTIIGGGISGLAAAACLAQSGHEVRLFEKNDTLGGRARQFSAVGFTFDMGPTWYWMPEIFENFYQRFGHTTSDFYQLIRLDPSYRVYFGKNDFVDVPADLERLFEMVETLEPGGTAKLRKYLREAEHKYRLGMEEFVFKPGLSVLEFADIRLAKEVFRLHLFRSISSYIRKYFSNPKLIQILEFPVLFLGAKPSETPALYSLMNYAEWVLGTWYPQGGMFKIIKALEQICREEGVIINTGANIEKLTIENGIVQSVIVNGADFKTDHVIASADYHHVEQNLLPKEFRSYSKAYWNSRLLSPSCLIFYVGLNKRISNLLHHNLFFDTDFNLHVKEIYDTKEWPSDPLFYVSCPSNTDGSVAPNGCETLFILIPVAVGLEDTETTREHLFKLVINRLEQITGENLTQHIVFKKSYAHKNYSADYNAFKGNAFGLANTLKQTAIFKPKMKSKKVKNLFFAGQLTSPGPGVPPALISGQVAAKLVNKSSLTIWR